MPRRESWGLAALGTIPLSMGAGDFCLPTPLAHLPFSGPKLRVELSELRQ